MGQSGDKNLSVVEGSSNITQFYTVLAGKFRRFHSLSLWQNLTNFKVNMLNLRDVVLVIVGFFQSIFYLMKIRPDVIFFKGGSVVVPIGHAARILRIPYMTHDSDFVPGMANRLISKGAKKNAVVSHGVLVYPADKTVVTGIPLSHEYTKRRGVERARYKQLLGFPVDSTLVFVYTGTQGSKVVDDAIETFLPKLLADHKDLHIACVYGRLNEQSMLGRYQDLDAKLAERLHKMKFIDNAFDYISAADIIIARAGATSLAEFGAVGRACIIIPAEQLTGGHQLLNAQHFADAGAVMVVRENELPVGLKDAVETLLEQPKLRRDLERKISTLVPDNAARIIAQEIIAMVKKEHRV